jgi:hypothetical protein
MKHLIITGLLALTLLTSCHWFSAGEAEPMTHNERIHQMIIDSLATIDGDLIGGYYYQPNGDYAATYDTQPEIWYGDGFYTTFDLEIKKDSLINHYSVIWSHETYARIPVPYEVIDSVDIWIREWHLRPETMAQANLDEYPIVPILRVYLNTECDLRHVNYIEGVFSSKKTTYERRRSLSGLW